MKRFIGVALLIALFFIGCSTPDDNINNGDNNNTTETITIDKLSVKDNSIKSLYVSDISFQNNSRSVFGDSTIQTLAYINSNGENTPFFFTSPSGKNIILNVSEAKQLDDKRILVDFTSFYEITTNENVYTIGETVATDGRALVDMESGKVYDFKDYKGIQFVQNDLLFTLENQTLYKIDLNNISTATPLNNPTLNPVYQLDPPLITTNKIIGFVSSNKTSFDGDHFIFDINSSYTPKNVQNASLTPSICSFVSASWYITFYNNGGMGLLCPR